MKYTIKSGIPIPSYITKPKDPESFSGKLRSLKKGQSVFKKGAEGSTRSQVYTVLGRGNAVCRKVDGGIRVWRIK